MKLITGLLFILPLLVLAEDGLELSSNSHRCAGEPFFITCWNEVGAVTFEWRTDGTFLFDVFTPGTTPGTTRTHANGNFEAVLTSITISPNDLGLFNSTLTVREAVNETCVECVILPPNGQSNIVKNITLTLSGTPSAPENLTFNGTILSWDRPAYTGGIDLSHYLFSYNGSNQSVPGETLASERTNPLHGPVSVYSVNECGQISAAASLSLPDALPLLSNPKTQWYCHQPLDQGRQVIIRWDVDTTGVSLPATWQASHGLSCDTDDNSCTGRVTGATQIELRVDNKVITDTYSVDIVPDNALFLDSGHNSVIVGLNPDCKPMVYKVDIKPCGVIPREGDDNLELRPGQSQELPVTTSCIEANLLSDRHVIESANITLQLSGASAPALGLPLLVMLGYVVLPQLAEVIQGR